MNRKLKETTFLKRFNPYRTDLVIVNKRFEYISLTNNEIVGCTMDFSPAYFEVAKPKRSFANVVQNVAFAKKLKFYKIIYQQCESGNWLAWYKHKDNAIANGETKEEAKQNLFELTAAVKYFNKKHL